MVRGTAQGRGSAWIWPGLLLGLVALWASLWHGDQPSLPVAVAAPGAAADAALPEFEARLLQLERSVAPDREEVPPIPPAGPPGGAAPADAEWQSIPITTFSFVRALADSPTPVQARWLFRNRNLNPRDVYLDATVRNALQDAFEAQKPDLVRLAQEIARSARAEFEQRIAAGAVPAVRYDDYVRGLDEQARREHDTQLAKAVAAVQRDGAINGFGPEAIEQDIRRIQVLDPLRAHGYRPFLTHRIDSDYYACRLANLPATGAVVHAYRDAFAVVVADITRILGAAGALDDAQREAIQKSALGTVDAKYDR